MLHSDTAPSRYSCWHSRNIPETAQREPQEMGWERGTDQKAFGHEEDLLQGHESFARTRVNHHHPVPSPAAVPGAPAAALPRTSAALTACAHSPARRQPAIEMPKYRQRDRATSESPGKGQRGQGGQLGGQRETTGCGDPSARC